MNTEGYTLWKGLVVNADYTSALEMGQQMMDLYFCASVVRDSDTCQMKGSDILAQVRECDALAEVKVFGTSVDATELLQAVGQGS